MAWGIVTNKPSRFTDPLIAQMDLTPAPAAVICPDHVCNTKPDPEALLLACRQMDIDPGQCVYVGDHPRDIEAGQRAGMPTVAVAWGYFDADERIDIEYLDEGTIDALIAEGGIEDAKTLSAWMLYKARGARHA